MGKFFSILIPLIILGVCVGWFIMMLWPRTYMKDKIGVTVIYYICILTGLGGAILISIYGR
jgi:purine-cytosine permease-like protein